jgi:arginase
VRRIAVLDAPSNLGLRPPTETSVPGCAKAPGALRDHGLLTRLGARDAGCLTPPRYDAGDWRPGDGVAHAQQIAAYSRRLADRIGAILDAGEFPVILGGDCSILLGSGIAMHRLGEAIGGQIGLVFVDGHSDFRHPGNASYVGAAAGEDLALVTGRGQADLASIEGRRPYFRDIDVVVMGIRAQDEYRLDLQAAGIITRPVPALRAEGAARSAQWARDQLADCAGYWVHVDVDVLDPAVMPAVDAPSAGGIAFPELELLLAGLVESPHCLGVELTVFDPDYDPDGEYAAEITSTVSAGLAPAKTVALRPDLAAARQDLDDEVTRQRRRAEAASVPPAAAGASGVSRTPEEAPRPATTLLPVEEAADLPAAASSGADDSPAADRADSRSGAAGADSRSGAVGADVPTGAARGDLLAGATRGDLLGGDVPIGAAGGDLVGDPVGGGPSDGAVVGDLLGGIVGGEEPKAGPSDEGAEVVASDAVADLTSGAGADLAAGPGAGADLASDGAAGASMTDGSETGRVASESVEPAEEAAEPSAQDAMHDTAGASDEDGSAATATGEPTASADDSDHHDSPPEASRNGRRGRPAPRKGSSDGTEAAVRVRPLGSAPLLDSEPLPATRPGMLRPRRAEASSDEPATREGFSLPTQRPAFDAGSGEPADIA